MNRTSGSSADLLCRSGMHTGVGHGFFGTVLSICVHAGFSKHFMIIREIATCQMSLRLLSAVSLGTGSTMAV